MVTPTIRAAGPVEMRSGPSLIPPLVQLAVAVAEPVLPVAIALPHLFEGVAVVLLEAATLCGIGGIAELGDHCPHVRSGLLPIESSVGQGR